MFDFPLQFERPGWLILLALIVPVFFIARRAIVSHSRIKATLAFALRVFVIVLLAVALSHPSWEKRGEGLTVTVVLDQSFSVPLPLKHSAAGFLDEAIRDRQPEDRVACIIVGRDAVITATPDRFSRVMIGDHEVDRSATNLAAGVRMALAIAPDDTANRIVLASDGNETIDSVIAAAQLARANNVPIDVIVLEYEHRNEVIFEQIHAPSRARLGQMIDLRLTLRSIGESSGTIYLRMNEEPLDLSPGQPGTGRRVTLRPGPTVIPLSVRMDEPGPAVFEAVFEPDDPEDDGIIENNRAMSVTFVSGEGRVLVIDDGSEAEMLVRALQATDIHVDRRMPDALGAGLVFLSGYDAVVLANMPRWEFTDDQDRMFHAYVHDLGGGLVMLGGPHSFGAGGWIESETAKALPVKLDPPQIRQMPRGALALVMHATEMPQGNYWAKRMAVAAIETLSRLDYIGIIEYNWQVRGNFGATWALPMQLVGDRSAAVAAANALVMGDMKNFHPMLELAYDGLMNNAPGAGQKHVILISDGDPSPPTDALLQKFADAKITITTIMVFGHGSAPDRMRMESIAARTGGRFYHVTNPHNLPQIFIKEAQMVARSLIQEGAYLPQVVSRMPGPIEGYAAVPGLRGYVLTSHREGLVHTPIVNTIEGEETADPIYAHWNYGLGKSIAFTSDVMGRWGGLWVGWDQFQAFWAQSIRWAMRPSTPANMLVNTRMEGDLAIVEVEALDTDASFLNFLQTRGVVLDPDNRAQHLPLQQVGPGRYRGEFRTERDGAYLVNINYSTPGGGESAAGNLQAAMTIPYSREYRSVTHNAALLEQVAAITGGRVIRTTDPAMADLFYRGELPVPRMPRAVWDLLAVLAACLFLLDVAARRLAIDPVWVTGLVRWAMGRRGEATGETVAAWKKTREQVAHRRPAPVAAKTSRTARFEASEDDAAKAIDVGGETPADMREKAAAAPRRDEGKPKPEQEEGPHTSRLLAAKRRARGEEPPDKPAP